MTHRNYYTMSCTHWANPNQSPLVGNLNIFPFLLLHEIFLPANNMPSGIKLPTCLLLSSLLFCTTVLFYKRKVCKLFWKQSSCLTHWLYSFAELCCSKWGPGKSAATLPAKLGVPNLLNPQPLGWACWCGAGMVESNWLSQPASQTLMLRRGDGWRWDVVHSNTSWLGH